MNLKKTVLSLFAATAILGSMLVPAYAENDVVNVNSETNEVGAFVDAHLWYSSINFATINVSATGGGSSTVDGSLEITDLRADSPGWTVTMQASDLTGVNDHEAFINAGQVTVVRRTNASLAGHSGCALPGQSGYVVNPSNGHYSLSFVPTATVPVALDTSTPVFKAESTRGNSRACGKSLGHPRFELTILPGQQIDAYTGTITITTVSGDPE